ncbi:MAG: hypothetical protein ACYSUC_08605 [Planctomycetota bacterium]|jgi:hypothetical protein
MPGGEKIPATFDSRQHFAATMMVELRGRSREIWLPAVSLSGPGAVAILINGAKNCLISGRKERGP